jgi:intracellular multiplication protein IcmP
MRSQPHPRAAWPSGDDNTGFNLIVILLGCCVGAYLLWTCYHGEISAGVITLRHHEIAFIRHFTDRYDLADRQMLAADPEGVTLRDLYVISHAVGMFFRVPAAVFMLLLAAICTVRAAPARYKRAFDLEGLIREQAASFRTSAAFVRRRLRLVTPAGASPRIGSGVGSRAGQRPNPRGKAGSSPDDPRPADYALTPEESIARFATALDGDFDEAAARRALVRQLGPAGAVCKEPARRSAACLLPLRCSWRRDAPTRSACSVIYRPVWPTRIRTSQRALTPRSLCVRPPVPRRTPSSATESW